MSFPQNSNFVLDIPPNVKIENNTKNDEYVHKQNMFVGSTLPMTYQLELTFISR